MGKVVAIHQPNFFPWLGYFDKIVRSDAFVLLDDVQFPKKGGTWINRVKLLVNGDAKWITAPVDRNYHGVRKIEESSYADSGAWRDKIMRTLEFSYGKHPYFAETVEVIEPLIRNPEGNVAEYNISALHCLVERLGIDSAKLIRASTLKKLGSSNEMLATLTLAVDGASYLCGGGADGYQDERIFAEHGVNLIYQSFQHPTYAQGNSGNAFVSGLSVIDAAMNLGWRGTGRLLGASREALEGTKPTESVDGEA